MASEDKRYLSTRRFKEFWTKAPWQKMRKNMG